MASHLSRLPGFDKYRYYTASVQAPPEEAIFLDKLYREVRGDDPQTLREDFCGTFAICCAWVRLGPERRAIGIDLDPEPLGYGCENYRARLNVAQQVRVQILQENVLTPGLPPADVIAALNFSYFIFKGRAELLAYFRNCYETLAPGGMVVLDCFGGPGAQKPNEERSQDEGFVYFFEQEGFDPRTHEAMFHIHFERKGEEKRRKAFTYDWRMWTMAEVREALLEAGFAEARVYWEDESGNGNGVLNFVHVDRIEKEPHSWVTYVVGLR
jgi:SAM-dependent methyltransferase